MGFCPAGSSRPASRRARPSRLSTKPQSIRIDDLVIEGAGGGVKGTIEFDGSGELQSANFPAYGFSDGDRASLKVERAPDGALRVVMRGDVYDGRAFVKSRDRRSDRQSAARSATSPDVDLDMKLGAVVGFNGEALRSVDLKMSRRAGEIRSFGLNAKIGRDATLTGELRGRGQADARWSICETTDAGALVSLHRRLFAHERRADGDRRWTRRRRRIRRSRARSASAILPSTTNRSSSAPFRTATPGTPQRHRFLRHAGRFHPHARARCVARRRRARAGARRHHRRRDRLRCATRCTCAARWFRFTVPTICSAQFPLVGLFLGGEKEGLVGVTYEVVGRPGNPVLHVNPISALAPGIVAQGVRIPAGQRATMIPSHRTPGPTGIASRSHRQTGLSRTCRFLPSESLTTPSAVTSASPIAALSLVTRTSLTMMALLAMARRTSPFDAQGPALTKAVKHADARP